MTTAMSTTEIEVILSSDISIDVEIIGSGPPGPQGPPGSSNYNDIINKPSINNVTLSGNKAGSELGLQNELVSGTNIKTINNTSLLGSGNITVASKDHIFVCTLNVTTFAEISQAVANNKLPILHIDYNNKSYIYSYCRTDKAGAQTYHLFVCDNDDNESLLYYVYSPNIWASGASVMDNPDWTEVEMKPFEDIDYDTLDVNQQSGGILHVNTTSAVTQNDTLPVTSGGVYTAINNIIIPFVCTVNVTTYNEISQAVANNRLPILFESGSGGKHYLYKYCKTDKFGVALTHIFVCNGDDDEVLLYYVYPSNIWASGYSTTGIHEWSELENKPFDDLDNHTLDVNQMGQLCVNTTDNAEQDNTLPITSSGVHTIVGNINALLELI